MSRAHQQLCGPIVLVWDNLNTHISAAMRELIATRGWLHVNRLPAYAPDLNPRACGHTSNACWFLGRRDNVSAPFDLSNLKTSLRCVPGLTAQFFACLNERNPPRRTSKVASCSRREFTRVLNAARRDVRQAAQRVRDGRELLRRWRAVELDNEPAEVR